jgi:hypothetical protein
MTEGTGPAMRDRLSHRGQSLHSLKSVQADIAKDSAIHRDMPANREKSLQKRVQALCKEGLYTLLEVYVVRDKPT